MFFMPYPAVIKKKKLTMARSSIAASANKTVVLGDLNLRLLA